MERRTLVTRAAALAGLIGLLSTASTTRARAIIDLRPNPPMPLGGYAPHTIIDVDVYLVDLDNPWTAYIRSLFLALDNTSPALSFPGHDRIFGTQDDNSIYWNEPPPLSAADSAIPRPAWISLFEGGIHPPFSIDIPDDGEVQIANIVVDVGAVGGTLDVIRRDAAFQFDGAYADGASSTFESILWSAYDGTLTGGQLQIVVPEPGTFFFVSVLLGSGLWLRRKRRLDAALSGVHPPVMVPP